MLNLMHNMIPVVLSMLLFGAGNRDVSPVSARQPKDGKLKALLEERLAALREVVRLSDEEYRTGRGSVERVCQARRSLLTAELETAESNQQRIAILEKIVAQAKHYEEHIAARHKIGVASASEVLIVRVNRLEAEIDLERVKSKGAAKTK